MIVCVSGVDVQPVFRRLSAALGVCADALPVVFTHQMKKLHGRFTRAAESVECGRHVSLVVTKLAGVLVLIVSLNDCIVFDEKFS